MEADCPSGHTCNADSGNCYIRVSRALCSPCQDALQCPAGGSCFEAVSARERFCTTPCGAADACPLGFTCTDLPTGPNTTATSKQCAPTTMSCNAGKPLCAACRGDVECGGPFDVCVRNVVSGETFCGRDCNPAKNLCIVNNCPDCPYRGEAFCTTPCVDDTACVRSFGVGFVCKNVTDTDGSMKKMCMPQRGSCAVGLGHLGDDCSTNGAQDCING